jgi:peroxiredoxin
MKKYFCLLIILLTGNSLSGQTITVKYDKLIEKKAALFSLSGEKYFFIDSINAGNNNEFNFTLRGKYPGFYRITFNNKSWLDFIYDNEDIELETYAVKIPDSLRIIRSEANKIYYEFVKLNKDYKTKTELLQLILTRYPEKDDYYNTTAEKLARSQNQYLQFVNVTSQTDPASFAARYVRSAQLPAVVPEIPPEKQLDYLKSHALDNVNFNDDGLIYSDAFTNKTIEYLTYYRNPQLPMELLEKEFEAAIDSILNKAKVNELVYKHITEYLLGGFKKFGFDNVINYIVENYVIKDDICLDEKLETALNRRIQQTKNFKTGDVVPNIILPDTSDSEIYLSKITADKTLIIFYSSRCPHCQTIIPELRDYYNSGKERTFEVIAVSIDTSRTDWLNFVNSNKLNWLNVSDLKGWHGQATKDYYIYATPTMFLVDKEKKIIIVPDDIGEIKDNLSGSR